MTSSPTPQSPIPDDIMQAALKVGETVCRNLPYDDVSVEVRAIARAILAERNSSKWQPIETAPKDEVVLCLGEPAGEMSGPYGIQMIFPAKYAGSSDFGGFDWAIPGIDYVAMWMKPTHWMPLPAPPEGK